MISSRIDDPSDNASLGTRKRGPRITRACQLCRARKVRCDGQSPCSGCRPSGVACVYRTSESKRTRGPTRVRSANPSETSVDRPFTTTYGIPPAVQVRHDPVKYKRLRELRAGIGVSNRDSGSFQFYGNSILSFHAGFYSGADCAQARRHTSALFNVFTSGSNGGLMRLS
jgi:hypothetical protein